MHTDTCTDQNLGVGIGILIPQAVISKLAIDKSRRNPTVKRTSSMNSRLHTLLSLPFAHGRLCSTSLSRSASCFEKSSYGCYGWNENQ